MRVLINAASARRGGILTYTQNLVSYMLDRGVDVKVAAPPDFPTVTPNVLLPVRAAGYGPVRRVLWEQLMWRRLVARVAPDVLFSSANFGLVRSPVPQVLLMREGGLFDHVYLSHIAPTQGVRVQITRHLRRRLMLMSTRHANHVITPSRAMRDSLLAWDPSLVDKSSVNHYGARHDLFHADTRERTWRADGTLRLLYVSVYYPHKRPNIICRAADLLRERNVGAHATITMTMDELTSTPGAALDRVTMRNALKQGTLSLGHHPYVELPGLYASHDVFVFPSVSETFGHPMVEAMASGLPIVASDTQINREICGDGAIYFDPFSADALVEKLTELDRDPALRERITTNARRHVRAEFKWEDHVDRLINTFEKVIEDARRKSL